MDAEERESLTEQGGEGLPPELTEPHARDEAALGGVQSLETLMAMRLRATDPFDQARIEAAIDVARSRLALDQRFDELLDHHFAEHFDGPDAPAILRRDPTTAEACCRLFGIDPDHFAGLDMTIATDEPVTVKITMYATAKQARYLARLATKDT